MKRSISCKIGYYSIILFISFIIILSGLNLPKFHQNSKWLSYEVTADSVCDKLSDGNAETTITFSTGGDSDTSAKLSLPKSIEVLSASFKVSGSPDNQDNYPSQVKIDVGDDGDLEWEFNLTSANVLGKQTEFIGSIKNKMIILDKGESDNSLFIRLPRNANIKSANLNVEGLYHGIYNADFETGTMAGWTITRNQGSDIVAVQNTRGGNDPSSLWGATNYYLMLRSSSFGTHDPNCDIIVESEPFPKLYTDYITMDWDLLDHDDFDLYIQIYDDTNTFVTARYLGGDDNTNNDENLTTQIIDIQTLTGNELNIYLRCDNGGWGWWNRNDWGRLAVDNIYLSDALGNPLPTYPKDFFIDVGNDGTKELEMPSLTGMKSVSGFKDALTGLLANPSSDCQVTTDKFGNEFLDIPLNVTILSSQGMVNITDLEITYDYEAKVDKNPRGTLKDELNSLISSSGVGSIIIPIAVWSSTPGKLKISDINIRYNAMPTASIIPTLEIDEDSTNYHFLNLREYYSDDSGVNQLEFEIAEHSAPDKLEAIIDGEGYLSLNANQEPDWYGEVILTVRATDSYGLMAESNPFIVKVLPVNDEPIPNVKLPKFTIWEDTPETTISLDKIQYFTDVEDDTLYYSVEVDPQEKIPNLGSNLYCVVNEDNELVILLNENWNGYSVPGVLYCDDDNNPIDTGITAPQQEFIIDVLPINDPPILEPFDTIFLDEDESVEDYLYLVDKASDVETPADLLTFNIMSNDNAENIIVLIDDQNYMDISIQTTDYVGSGKVKIQVEDEDGAIDEETVKIIINSKNDAPKILRENITIKILEDIVDTTSLNLYDIFYDPDSPITFSVTGNMNIDVTISQETGAVTFKPNKDWFGTEFITFSALDTYIEDDNTSQKSSTSVKVKVIPINDPPETPKILSPLSPRTDTENHQVTFKSDDAIDVDSSELEYYWDFDDSVDSDGDGDPTNDQNGVGQQVEYNYSISGYYHVTLWVSDGEFDCEPKAGIYVKVTTDIDKTTQGIKKESEKTNMDLIFSIPFILIIIILIFWVLSIVRKNKRDEREDLESDGKRGRMGKPAVVDGELVSEQKVTPTAQTVIPPKTQPQDSSSTTPPGPTKQQPQKQPTPTIAKTPTTNPPTTKN